MKPIYVAIPTRDGQVLIHTVFELFSLGKMLGRPLRFLIGEAGNIPRSRNLVMEQARTLAEPATMAWLLWIDSDILIPSGMHTHIAHAIRWAENSRRAWIANYRSGDGLNVLIRERRATNVHYYSDGELDTLPPYASVGMGGLGCAYLPMNLSYTFHADVPGEDIHFFLDPPDLRVFYAKSVLVKHR